MKEQRFFVINEQIEYEIKAIKRRLMLSMNGIVADSMTEKGLKYKQNYGVELMVLAQMAQTRSKSVELADRLWLEGIRETIILSVLTYPVEQLTVQKAKQLVTAAPTKEIIDILCHYLLSKTTFAQSLCVDLINDTSENSKVCGYMLVTKLFNTLSETDINSVINSAIVDSTNNSFNIYSSLAIALSRLCRVNSNVRARIESELLSWGQDTVNSKKYIADKVNQELNFLKNL